MKKLKVGDRVHTIENHPYLGISRRHVGIVVRAQTDTPYGDDSEIGVQFTKSTRLIIFGESELKLVKTRKAKATSEPRT